jgi:ADP-heptose:LPS heptosyltransferase
MAVERILIYRFGFLGDSIVALPSFHLIARAFPNATKVVLTNVPASVKAAPSRSILDGTGLVHGYIEYSLTEPFLSGLWKLRKRIREFNPDLLIHLSFSERGLIRVAGEAAFFAACGVPRMIGLPYLSSLGRNQPVPGTDRWEAESVRLARCLESLGDSRVEDAASWDLHLSAAERDRADSILREWKHGERFVALSIGAKADVKDWGEENWKELVAQLWRRHQDLGLVLVGVTEETDLSERISERWTGPKLNLCGKLSPRETAALLGRALAFVGHDSGPMHLAAAQGTTCVAIFSAQNKPGVWYPHGSQHKILYHRTECFGCRLDVCTEHGKKCIRSISISEVLTAVEEVVPFFCHH